MTRPQLIRTAIDEACRIYGVSYDAIIRRRTPRLIMDDITAARRYALCYIYWRIGIDDAAIAGILGIATSTVAKWLREENDIKNLHHENISFR